METKRTNLIWGHDRGKKGTIFLHSQCISINAAIGNRTVVPSHIMLVVIADREYPVQQSIQLSLLSEHHMAFLLAEAVYEYTMQQQKAELLSTTSTS